MNFAGCDASFKGRTDERFEGAPGVREGISGGFVLFAGGCESFADLVLAVLLAGHMHMIPQPVAACQSPPVAIEFAS